MQGAIQVLSFFLPSVA